MDTCTDEFFVLLVEDNLADVETVRRTAEKIPFAVQFHPIKNGRDALEYLVSLSEDPRREPVPDLILLDLNLPGMRGQRLLKNLRQDPYWENTPIVIFSGSNEQQEIHRCYNRGANAYVLKPRSPRETVGVLRDMFSFYRNQSSR